jgi:nicotinamide-nucleotide amidase
MLEGTLKISGTDYSAAISGVAGPNGGSELKPVGCVYIGVKHKSGIQKIEKIEFIGDRELIQLSAANYALKMLCEIFQEI